MVQRACWIHVSPPLLVPGIPLPGLPAEGPGQVERGPWQSSSEGVWSDFSWVNWLNCACVRVFRWTHRGGVPVLTERRCAAAGAGSRCSRWDRRGLGGVGGRLRRWGVWGRQGGPALPQSTPRGVQEPPLPVGSWPRSSLPESAHIEPLPTKEDEEEGVSVPKPVSIHFLNLSVSVVSSHVLFFCPLSQDDDEVVGPDGNGSYQHMVALPHALMELRHHAFVTQRQAREIIALWQNLSNRGKAAVSFPPVPPGMGCPGTL